MEEIQLNSISDLHQYIGQEKPEHPHFSVVRTRHKSVEEATQCTENETRMTFNFYTISYKHIIGGEILYGRTKYDFADGSMLFTSPGQSVTMKGVSVVNETISINIHEDFLAGTEIRNRFKKYGFFSYSTNEALHLSPKEEKQVKTIMGSIHSEYENNQDEFSKDIILSQLDALLKYANRFYKRQFLNREEINGQLYDKFYSMISEYFESRKHDLHGLPNVEAFADKLHVTSRYLSDALKVETGKTTMDHIHLFIIEEAKNLLLDSNATVQEVAYKLGFDYPQYFSRLFKSKVGISPTQYQKEEGRCV